MALVANYTSSEESDVEEEQEAVKSELEPFPSDSNQKGQTGSNVDIDISDEEDEFHGQDSGILDEAAEDIPGLSSSLFQGLSAKSIQDEKVKKDFVDTEEDLSSIPQPNESEKSSAPSKPAKKKLNGRKGPVRIMAPSLKEVDGTNAQDDSGPSIRFTGAKAKSTLLSILPQPKNAPAQPARTTVRSLVPDSVRKRPNPGPSKPVPNSAKVAKVSVPEYSDSDDDEEGPSSFFTLEAVKFSEEAAAQAVKAALPQVHANPEPVAPKASVSSHGSSSRVCVPEAEIVAPAVGPSRPVYPVNAYPDANDLMANTDALERLAGKHALKQADGIDVVDVNAKALQADPREWMVKALTEEDSDKPGPRNSIKGQTKRKHQITYLAAQAKENEHKLKAQWANSAANKRAAGARYGFF